MPDDDLTNGEECRKIKNGISRKGETRRNTTKRWRLLSFALMRKGDSLLLLSNFYERGGAYERSYAPLLPEWLHTKRFSRLRC